MKKIIATIITILLSLLIVKKILNALTKKIIFVPSKKDEEIYNQYLDDENIIHETLITQDNIKISSCLYNANKIPSYDDDNIIILSHGNSGILSKIIYEYTAKKLSKYGSLFIYDYRGYGDSSGKPTYDGLFNDIMCVWNFLTQTKKISPNKITLFGHSLGTTVSSYLITQLIKTNQEYPKRLILQNPFYCIKRLAKEFSPLLSHFVIAPYETYKFFKYMDEKVSDINIIIIHCYDDELISCEHSKDLKKIIKNNKCELFLTDGSHNRPIYNDDVYKMLGLTINNKNIENNMVKT